MSYLLPSTTEDELMLMIAYEEWNGPDGYFWMQYPEPTELTPEIEADPGQWYGTMKGQPQRFSGGFIYLSNCDTAREAYRKHYFYESPRSYRAIHLTWKGWDRVKEILDAGTPMPTPEEMTTYAQQGHEYARTGVDPRTGISNGYRERQPGYKPPKKPSLWKRVFRKGQ